MAIHLKNYLKCSIKFSCALLFLVLNSPYFAIQTFDFFTGKRISKDSITCSKLTVNRPGWPISGWYCHLCRNQSFDLHSKSNEMIGFSTPVWVGQPGVFTINCFYHEEKKIKINFYFNLTFERMPYTIWLSLLQILNVVLRKWHSKFVLVMTKNIMQHARF